MARKRYRTEEIAPPRRATTASYWDGSRLWDADAKAVARAWENVLSDDDWR